MDFTVLKRRTRTFIADILRHIFVASQHTIPYIGDVNSPLTQARNRKALEEVFMKAIRVENLAMGILYFMKDAFPSSGVGDDNGDDTDVIKWGCRIAKETLIAQAMDIE